MGKFPKPRGGKAQSWRPNPPPWPARSPAPSSPRRSWSPPLPPLPRRVPPPVRRNAPPRPSTAPQWAARPHAESPPPRPSGSRPPQLGKPPKPPSPRPQKSSRRPHTAPLSPSRRGSPTSSSPPRPSRGTPPALSLSPRRGSPASSSPASTSSSESTKEETPIFDVYLDDNGESLRAAFSDARKHFSDMLKEDSVALVDGKLVAHPRGSFMLRIKPSSNSEEEPLYALYRSKDLYLDSILVRKVWRRFCDCEAELPEEIPYETVQILDMKSNYSGLGYEPKVDNQILFGHVIFRKVYDVLIDIDLKLETARHEVQQAFMSLVLYAEGLRFPDLEAWMLESLASHDQRYAPKEITEFFQKWGKLSDILHKGRDKFIFRGADPILKRCKTYDDVWSLLGIIKRFNPGKQKRRPKKMKRRVRMKT